MPPRRTSRKGFVARHTPRPQPRPPTWAADSPAIQQGGQRHTVVALTPTQREADRLAVSLGAHVDLGRNPAPAAPQRLTAASVTAASSAGRMLVGAHDDAVHEVQVPLDQAGGLGLGLQGFEDALPDAGLAPAVKAARYRSDRPVALGQGPPGRAGAQDPENAIEDGSMFMVWAAGARPLWRKQGRELLPLPIRQLITCHDLQMASQSQRATLCRHGLEHFGIARDRVF